MPNPMLQDLQIAPKNNLLQRVAQIRSMMQGRNPQDFLMQMANSNPQFRDFVQQNSGKSPQEIMRNYGLDPSLLGQILGK